MKRKSPLHNPPDDPEQSGRFVETAKTLEVDKSGKAFAIAVKKIIPKKKRAAQSSRP